jgi:murein DD-endopeptidase MepM/ murein hydrolase activator NlpD
MNALTRRDFLRSAPAALGLAGFGLKALGDRVYTVRKGDTLSEISQDYGVSVRDLKRHNNLNSDLIRVGDRLVIPGQSNSLKGVIEATRKARPRSGRWKYIVAHHSAVKNGNAKSYDSYHRRRGMENGLAYHFVIGNGIDSGDGEIEIGNRWVHQIHGGHVRNPVYNEHGIGICLVGNFEKTRPTSQQMDAFTSLVSYLGYDLLDGDFKFTVHKEVDQNHTVCPGRYFPVSSMHRRFN